MSSVEGASEGTEGGSADETMQPAATTEATSQQGETGAVNTAASQGEGRRTQLKILRENVGSLNRDVGSFRKSHEASAKRLEAQIAALRKDLATHTRSKDLGDHVKSHEAGTKRLEKQVASLHGELAGLKSSIAKDAARSRAKQEATLAKILAKVSAKPKASKKK
ncbi:MAG: hypothetical protein ABSF83_07865 [Nitrososphaerales archaeon]